MECGVWNCVSLHVPMPPTRNHTLCTSKHVALSSSSFLNSHVGASLHPPPPKPPKENGHSFHGSNSHTLPLQAAAAEEHCDHNSLAGGSFQHQARKPPKENGQSFHGGKSRSLPLQAAAAEVYCDRRFAVGASMVALLGSFVTQAFPAVAAVSKKVKLGEVENPKLQEALRAAIGGDLEGAEILFSELIEEDKGSASQWSNRGSVRLSLGKFEEAEKDLTTAIRLAPDAPVPFLNRAIAYESLGRYEEAISDCKSAISNDPDEYAAWYNLGNVDVDVKDYPAALEAYERASSLAPGIAGYRLKQALVLFQLQRPDEASKLIQGLVRKYPNYAEAHAALAALLWSEDRRSSAEDQFSKAVNEEPNFEDIRWVRKELQWPPAIMEAMTNFLNVTM